MNVKSLLSIINIFRDLEIDFDDIIDLIDLGKVIAKRVREEKEPDDNTPGKLTLVEIDEIAGEAIKIALDNGIIPPKYEEKCQLALGVLVAIEELLGGDED